MLGTPVRGAQDQVQIQVQKQDRRSKERYEEVGTMGRARKRGKKTKGPTPQVAFPIARGVVWRRVVWSDIAPIDFVSSGVKVWHVIALPMNVSLEDWRRKGKMSEDMVNDERDAAS
jgi:hypothetical protein